MNQNRNHGFLQYFNYGKTYLLTFDFRVDSPQILSLAECLASPARLLAMHSYSPPSSGFTVVILTWDITSPYTVTYWPIRSLSFCGSGNPSSSQEICGVGLPAALHFRETDGPGCIVCSINLQTSCGAISVNRRYGQRLRISQSFQMLSFVYPRLFSMSNAPRYSRVCIFLRSFFAPLFYTYVQIDCRT